ncbi:MAG: RNA polymerase subunit sigma-70 [Paludibacteraceae bacterium]|nr:RNA polymerase subunit sigma-70 [Paludibacteraceae bacterium]
MQATISADIVSSTAMELKQLIEVQQSINELIRQLSAQGFISWGRMSKGDNIECYLKDPKNSLRVALLLKSFIKKTPLYVELDASEADDKNKRRKRRLNLFTTFGVRIAIAVGSMRIAEESCNVLDGEAIYASGRAIEQQKTSNRKKITIKSTLFFHAEDEELNDRINAYLGLIDVLFKRATARQCEVIFHRLTGKTEEEISKLLGISQSAVNQHSTQFGWKAIEQVLKHYEHIKF